MGENPRMIKVAFSRFTPSIEGLTPTIQENYRPLKKV